MFSYEILKDDGVIVLTTVGLVTMEDYQTVAPKFFADVRSTQSRKLLMDSRRDDGWSSKEAESIAFHAWTESRTLFDRIAVVFHDGIREKTKEFSEFFHNANTDIRLFRPDQYDTALDWLKNGEAETLQ